MFMSRSIKKLDFKLTSDAKIQPAITGKAREAVALTFSRYGHALVTLYV